MKVDHLARYRLKLAQLLYFGFPKRLIAAYLVTAVVAYIFVAVHTPRLLYPTKPHDDGLYIAHGVFLSEGRWLGPFSEFTLMKGPGYPAFLAAANWLGLPVSLASALFHCATILIFVWVSHACQQALHHEASNSRPGVPF